MRPTRLKPASLTSCISLRTSLYLSRRSALMTTSLSGEESWASVSCALRFWSGTQFWPTKTLPSCLMASVSCFGFSGILSGLGVSGSATSTPVCNNGVTTMKMMSSTKQTSTKGVTLMSLFTALTRSGLLCLGSMLAPLPLHEEVDELGGRVRHLELQPLELAGEVVEHPGRRNGDAEAEGGGDERLGDTGGHGAEAARAGHGDAVEGVDDADHGAEQADERGDGGDGGQRADAALEVGGGQQRGALDGAGRGLDDL